MINKINEFLLQLDKTKKLLIYMGFFLFIGFIGGYINFNLYNDISQKEKDLKNLQIKFKKMVREISIAKKNIDNLKVKYNKKLKYLSLLKDDLKYLLYNIHLSNLYISTEKFYSILEKILEISSKYSINANFLISIKDKDKFLKSFILTIEGSFPCYNYFNYLNFLKDIQSLKFVKEVKVVKAMENDKDFIDFEIKVIFWSVK